MEAPEDLKRVMKPGEIFVKSFWLAQGQSWKGNAVKRDGKRVECGHEHRTEMAAIKCAIKMWRHKPGNCQRYGVVQIFRTMIRKHK